MTGPYNKPSILFVTPAYKRYELSAICFKQRAWMIDELKKLGIESNCVVIADDLNLELARANGFHEINAPNDYLGRKFNLGHEFAVQQGYDFSAPVGSDMFIDPSVFAGISYDHEFYVTSYYAVLKSNGQRMATMRIPWGVLQFFSTKLSKALDNKPCSDRIPVGCDTHTRMRIVRKTGVDLTYTDGHQYECVSFQSEETQITKFHRLTQAYKADLTGGVPKDILKPLKPHYTAEHISDIVSLYSFTE